MSDILSLPSLEALRKHVLTVLCAHDQLDPEQTPLQESVLLRGPAGARRPCGLHFEVRGPRRVRTYAIWAGEEDRLLFYDSAGQRFAEVRLSEAPDPLRLAG
jgi:hypothetical protein